MKMTSKFTFLKLLHSCTYIDVALCIFYFNDSISENVVCIAPLVKKMTCTVKKCWPDKLSNSHCSGILKKLSDINDSPEEFLKSRSAWGTAQRQTENPEFMWQVLLSQITVSNFSSEEISTFKICSSHEVFL